MKKNINFRKTQLLRPFEICLLWMVHENKRLEVNGFSHWSDAYHQSHLQDCFNEEHVEEYEIWLTLTPFGEYLLSKVNLTEIPTDPDMYLHLWSENLEYEINS